MEDEILDEEFPNEDIAKFLLRFSVGFLMLFHGFNKIVSGIAFLERVFLDLDIPAFFASTVYFGEVLAPLMLIFGLRIRLAAILIILTMFAAIYFAHFEDVFSITRYGAWEIEVQMFYILTSLVILFQGADRFSLDRLYSK